MEDDDKKQPQQLTSAYNMVGADLASMFQVSVVNKTRVARGRAGHGHVRHDAIVNVDGPSRCSYGNPN